MRGAQGQAGLAAGCREGNVPGRAGRVGCQGKKPAVVKTGSLRKAPWQGPAAGRAAGLMLCPARPTLPKPCQTHVCGCWHPMFTPSPHPTGPQGLPRLSGGGGGGGSLAPAGDPKLGGRTSLSPSWQRVRGGVVGDGALEDQPGCVLVPWELGIGAARGGGLAAPRHPQPSSSPSGCTGAASRRESPRWVTGLAEMLPRVIEGLGSGQGRRSRRST